MSFDNHWEYNKDTGKYVLKYPNRKDHRKLWYDNAKRCDRSCRNHGSDSWDYENRTRQQRVQELRAQEQIDEYETDPDFSDAFTFAELGPCLEYDPMDKDVYSLEEFDDRRLECQ